MNDAVTNMIFDIGMHSGEDTGYYLQSGYNVVAVEAEPTLCELVAKKYDAEVERGQLTILNVGINETYGEFEFYLSSLHSEWNSFDIENASKGGGTATKVTVPCVPYRHLVEQFGIPYYVKIDIEGNDWLCLKEMKPGELSQFVSIEMAHSRADTDINRLYELGYRNFKIIRQNDFCDISAANVGSQIMMRRALNALGGMGVKINGKRYRRRRKARHSSHWRFPEGSSGPFGKELSGAWMCKSETLDVWDQLRKVDLALDAKGLGEWFDIHVSL